MRSILLAAAVVAVVGCHSSTPPPVDPHPGSNVAQGSGTPVEHPVETPPPTEPSLEKQGAELYLAKGCITCHSIDGTSKVGRSMKGIWDQDVTLSDGRVLHVDAKYIRDSVSNPAGYGLPGYSAAMPAYVGTLTDKELDMLVAYIQSLR